VVIYSPHARSTPSGNQLARSTAPAALAALLWPVAQLGSAFKLTGTHLLHHVIGASLIAALMLVLEGFHVLEWLDAAMLRASAAQGQLLERGKDPGAAYRPGIIEIDQPAFEQVFDEREPLERSRLEQLIASAAARGSKVAGYRPRPGSGRV